jgi:hypothetical protein
MAEKVEIPSVYSNSVNLISSFFDLILTFSVNEPYTEKGKTIPQIKPLIRVSMSPAHFKAFAVMCMNNIEGYEKQFGAIKLPKARKKAKKKKR